MRQHAITLPNVDQVSCRHMKSLSQNSLNMLSKTFVKRANVKACLNVFRNKSARQWPGHLDCQSPWTVKKPWFSDGFPNISYDLSSENISLRDQYRKSSTSLSEVIWHYMCQGYKCTNYNWWHIYYGHYAVNSFSFRTVSNSSFASNYQRWGESVVTIRILGVVSI